MRLLKLSFWMSLVLVLSSTAWAELAGALAVIGTIPAPDGGWDQPSVDGGARRLYVAHGNAVLAVDLDSGKVTPGLVEGKRLHSVLPLPDGKALATNGDGTALLFETASGKSVATIDSGKGAAGLAWDAASGLALVVNRRAGSVTLIDPKTAKAVGSIDVGGRPGFAAADGNGRAYVTIRDKAEIAVLDIAGRTVSARYPLEGCRSPGGLALDPATGVLLAACVNKRAILLQSKDGAAMASLPIGARSDGAVFDPTRQLFFVPGGDGTLTVIRPGGAKPSVLATIETANGARSVALDAKTGKLYLPTADFAPSADGKRKHAVVPGTFRILVVGEKA